MLLGRYEVLKPIGRGPAGPVFSARDHQRNCNVLIKEIEVKDPAEIATLLEHAPKLVALRHPHLVAVQEMFSANGRVFLAVDHVEAESVATRLRRMVRSAAYFPLAQVMAWAEVMCDVLQYLHDQDIVYGALKPVNVLVDDSGFLWLVDPDAARLLHRQALGTTIPLTPGFAAIEQYSKQTGLDRRLDLYALGATLYQLITKEVPPSSVDRMMGTALRPPSEKNAHCPEVLDEVILKLMALQREERFPDAVSARQALAGAVLPTMEAPFSMPSMAVTKVLDVGATLSDRYVVETVVEVDARWGLYIGYDTRESSRTLAITEMCGVDAERARARASALAATQAPHLEPVTDVVGETGVTYLISDWMDGVALSDLIGGMEGFVPNEVAVHVLEQLCEMLHHLHGREEPVALGELTPAHVMFLEDGGLGVTGFPLGRIEAGHGVEHYSSPSVSPFLADVYALGAVMYSVLTRRVPGPDATVAEVNPDVPRPLNDLVARLMGPEEQRPQSPNELREMMQKAIVLEVPSETQDLGVEDDDLRPIGQMMGGRTAPPRETPKVTATVWWPAESGLRGLWKGKAEDEAEEVEVIDLSVDALTIVSEKQRKPGLAIRVKMSIPRRGRPDARLDVKTVIETAEAHLGRWRYSLDLGKLPVQLRDILATAGADRRQAPRVRCCLKVTSADFIDARAVIEEISATGCLLNSAHSFAPGTPLGLEAQADAPIRVQGRVVHCKPVGSGRHAVGIAFEAITATGAAALKRTVASA